MKNWYASKGIWGGLIAAAAPIVGGLLHVSITGDDVNTAMGYVSEIVGAAGGLLAVYGRVKATKQIGTAP